MTKFKFDPITQCSEVSLLKDLISQDNLSKFNKANLNEVKIGFYNRRHYKNPQSKNSSMIQSIDYVDYGDDQQ